MNLGGLFVAVALATPSGGCTLTGSDNAPSPDVTAVPQPPTTTLGTASWLPVAEPQDCDLRTSDTYVAAAIEGTPVIDGDARCVWIDAYRKVAVVFPPGTVLRPGSPAEAVLPDGTVVRDGDFLVGGGGLGWPGPPPRGVRRGCGLGLPEAEVTADFGKGPFDRDEALVGVVAVGAEGDEPGG